MAPREITLRISRVCRQATVAAGDMGRRSATTALLACLVAVSAASWAAAYDVPCPTGPDAASAADCDLSSASAATYMTIPAATLHKFSLHVREPAAWW